MTTQFPYPVLTSGDMTLQVDEVRIDGASVSLTLISESDHVVALHRNEKQAWAWAGFVLSVEVTGSELDDGPWSDIECFALLRNERARVRKVSKLRQVNRGRWSGEIDLHADEMSGRSEIDACLVATVHGVPGRLIASAKDKWAADPDVRTPTRQRSVKMEWRDFTDESYPELNPHYEDFWHLEAAGDEPKIYLNSAVDGLRELLNGTGRGLDKAVREQLFSQIATEAWVGMFNAAAFVGEMEDDIAQWPGGWHEEVLRRMLPDVFPGLSPDDALAEVIARRVNGHSGGDLQSRVLHAAGVQAKIPKTVSGTLRALARSGNSAKESGE